MNINEAKNEVKNALRDAGGNRDVIVFHDKRVIKVLEELKIFWCEYHEKEFILANRHEIDRLIAG